MKELLGSRRTDLVKPKIGPRVILLAGLQGVGKTTACGKMAKYLTENEEDVLVVSTDVYRCSPQLCCVHAACSSVQGTALVHFLRHCVRKLYVLQTSRDRSARDAL